MQPPGMSRTTNLPSVVLIFVSFLGVAAAQAWPLPLYLTSALTGSPTGDTGVYVWNIWVFSHEIARGNFPFSTDTVLAFDGPADLSLHNYTVFSNLLAMPLQPWLGVVGAFNVVYLLQVALAGLGVFVLVQRLGRTSTAVAWLAALLFACSPFLAARGIAHFSLVAAAPLPFFVWCFDRAWETRRVRDAVLTGACVAWAAYCDLYYAAYCAMLGACLVAARVVHVTISPRESTGRLALRVIDGVIVAIVCAVLVVYVIGGGSIRIGSLSIAMRTLYTPMLILTALVTARVLLMLRPRCTWTWTSFSSLVAPAAAATATATVLLAPILYAITMRLMEGRLVSAPILWRSSAPGVDLVSWLIPNPNHPLAPDSLVDWVIRQPGGYTDNVSSIPWIALLVILAAWRWAGHRPDRIWTAIGVLFASLALGPFVRIMGVDTFVPTPWSVLRYVPLIGEARMPSRFSVLVIMAVAVVFAGALGALLQRYSHHRRLILTVVGVALAFELLPAPRQLHSAAIPRVYETIARDPRPLLVLNLPFGVRDGLSSLGDFNASSLFFQTLHHKSLLGGYLSRVSDVRKEKYFSHPVSAALLVASEGGMLAYAQQEMARSAVTDFVHETGIGWVVIDESRASSFLVDFVIDVLSLTQIERSDPFVLYTPASIE